jgi:hypothetical protein
LLSRSRFHLILTDKVLSSFFLAAGLLSTQLAEIW